MSSSHAQPTGEQDTSSTAPTHGNAPVDNRRCNMGEFDEGWHAMFPRPAGDNADRFVEYYWRSAKWQALIRAVFFPTASQGLYWAEHGEIWDSSLRNLWFAHGVSLHLFDFGKLVHTGISRLDRFVVGSSDGTVELKRVLVAQRKKMNQVLLLTVTELQKIVRSADRCPMEKPVGYHLPMDLILVVERFVFESYSPARLEQEQYGFWTAIYRQAIEGLPEEEVKCADPRIIDFYSGDPSEVREEIEHNSIASATQLFGGRMPQLTDFELRVVAFRAEFQRFPLRLRPLLSDVEDERASRMIHASFLLDGPLYREELIRHRNQHHAYMAIKYIQFWLLTIDKQRRFPDDMAGPCEAEMMEFEAMHQRLSREIFRVEIAPDLSQRSSCFHNVDDLLMFHRKIIGNVLNDCDTLWEEIKEAGVRGLRRAIYQDWAQGPTAKFLDDAVHQRRRCIPPTTANTFAMVSAVDALMSSFEGCKKRLEESKEMDSDLDDRMQSFAPEIIIELENDWGFIVGADTRMRPGDRSEQYLELLKLKQMKHLLCDMLTYFDNQLVLWKIMQDAVGRAFHRLDPTEQLAQRQSRRGFLTHQ